MKVSYYLFEKSNYVVQITTSNGRALFASCMAHPDEMYTYEQKERITALWKRSANQK